MKLARVAAALALLGAPVTVFLARPVHAQMPNINLIPETQSKTPEEREAEQERDKAYKESLKKIPDAKTSNDPWGTVRSDTPKSTAAAPSTKTTAKRARTGSSAN
ncbi:hypothetical protein [Bradyrhizobium sp. ARR65]|uniref:hypothetical protein n=1 Tax=Bradyrhizobium sp. ARR65 TaxID=1040989 RepID=UPI00046547F5|nr:hypothetical protein [Bradyrhizobium sp. ARR65]